MEAKHVEDEDDNEDNDNNHKKQQQQQQQQRKTEDGRFIVGTRFAVSFVRRHHLPTKKNVRVVTLSQRFRFLVDTAYSHPITEKNVNYRHTSANTNTHTHTRNPHT